MLHNKENSVSIKLLREWLLEYDENDLVFINVILKRKDGSAEELETQIVGFDDNKEIDGTKCVELVCRIDV